MKFGDSHRSLAAWVALLAISLQALWPLIAQAKPRSVTLVPVCSVGGETHYVELETGGTAQHEEHCKACPVGVAALAGNVAAFVVPACDFSIPAGEENAAESRFLSYAHPRAPPSFLIAGMKSDNQESKDEKAVDVGHRGARDAVAGRGVVRRGVLLG